MQGQRQSLQAGDRNTACHGRFRLSGEAVIHRRRPQNPLSSELEPA
ncbi:hypothetical protein YSA_04749 [Pseudomonas putida ND6]|uniref:Uncharacterized protein n=1 Tax=Pseudomonas putida ND6 TaxID=231023 RepID=I3UV20_PSEPU|nr:hypothetical protein YSA_04749 [Pseudomonas putida ND6]